MALPPKLEAELADLQKSYEVDTVEESAIINLVFKRFPLGDGYNVASSDLLVRIPRTYPDAGPDMFWVEPNVTLANGAIPQSAEAMENYINRQWRRFSWHWKNGRWDANIDNMHGYIEFIRKRLREKR